MKKLLNWLKNHESIIKRILFFFVLSIGVFVRVWRLSSNPAGINQDEASAGYDSWAMLTYGIDRNGFHNPMHLISWGAGQSILYSLLSMPFIKIFGLTVFSIRLPNAILSCITLLVFYFSVKKTANFKVALIGLFLLAINPWQVMGSRWGFEANLFPMIFMLGFLLLTYAKNRLSLFYLSIFFFALSLYAYTPAFFIVPLFVFFMGLWVWRANYISFKTLLISLILFALISFPYGIFLFINAFGLQSIQTFFISIPKLVDTGRFSDIFILFQSGPITKTLKNMYEFFSFLFIKQSDGLIWNSIPQYGYAYIFSAPFLLHGIILIYKNYRKLFFWTLWLSTSFFLACITVFNMNRLSILFLPLIFCITLSLSSIYEKHKTLFAAAIFMYVVIFASFLKFYFFQYPSYIGPTFFESLGEAIQTASSLSKNSPIIVTDKVNMPQIYVLFYEKIPPYSYLKTVKFKNPGAQFQQVLSFDRYSFGINPKKIDPGRSYVFKNNDEEYFDKGFTIQRFKYYSVAYPSVSVK